LAVYPAFIQARPNFGANVHPSRVGTKTQLQKSRLASGSVRDPTAASSYSIPHSTQLAENSSNVLASDTAANTSATPSVVFQYSVSGSPLATSPSTSNRTPSPLYDPFRFINRSSIDTISIGMPSASKCLALSLSSVALTCPSHRFASMA